MTDTNQTAADTATGQAIDSVIANAPLEKQQEAFNRASIEHRRSAPSDDESPTEESWRDGELAPMPPAPHVETSEVDRAIAKLNERGADHAALVQSWGSDFSDNLGYAKAAFKEIAASDPDLIATVERAGLGDHPAVLKILAKQGRLTAGLMGQNTSRRNTDMTTNPVNREGPTGTNRGGSARDQLDELMAANPPLSASYRTPSVQRRVEALSREIAGGGSIIGRAGRRT